MSSKLDAVVAEHDLQARDVRALGLRQLVDVAFEEMYPARGVEDDAVGAVLEPAHLVHPAGPTQFARAGRPVPTRRCPAARRRR